MCLRAAAFKVYELIQATLIVLLSCCQSMAEPGCSNVYLFYFFLLLLTKLWASIFTSHRFCSVYLFIYLFSP